MEGMVKVQVLRAACCVAGSDGNADPTERKILEMLAAEVGVGEASLDAMLQRAETEPNYVEDQFRVLKSDPKESMRLLFSVALSDGVLQDSELNVLQRLAAKLNVTDEVYQNWLVEARAYLAKKTNDESS